MKDNRMDNIHSEPGFFSEKACSQFANIIVKFFQDPANMAEFKIWQAKRHAVQAAK